MRSAAQALLCKSFGPFGEIFFPYVKMGKIDSLDLFGVTELIIFALYYKNKDRYFRVLDIGANLGLHSIVMSRLNWDIQAFEPDPQHFQSLQENLRANWADSLVYAHNKAVSTQDGLAPFVRVLDNLTGNHLEGCKASYGPKEKITVPTMDCRPLFDWADFAKIDSEGNEAELLLTTTAEQMKHLEVIVEVRNEYNAKQIYEHFMGLNVGMWSQKINWHRVKNLSHMPHLNREGSLFIGREAPF
jgi:FkbM family methyltransferase